MSDRERIAGLLEAGEEYLRQVLRFIGPQMSGSYADKRSEARKRLVDAVIDAVEEIDRRRP